MPKISVIVPVYKVEKYLDRCVESILNQTFTDFECILVDDGSPDNCGKMCEEYAKKDNRVVVIHQENRGVSNARNSGIERAFKNSDSDWISFVDSDDFVDKDFLECFYKPAAENNVDIVYAGIRYLPSGREIFPAYDTGKVMSGIAMIETNPHVFSNITIPFSVRYFIRKKFLFNNNIKFSEGIKYAEDSIFNLRLLSNAEAVICIPQISYNYATRENPITSISYKPSMLKDSDSYHAIKMQVAKKLTIGKYEYMKDMAILHVYRWLPSIIENFKNSKKGFRMYEAKQILNANFLQDSIDFIIENDLIKRKLQKIYFHLIQKRSILMYCVWKYFNLDMFVG